MMNERAKTSGIPIKAVMWHLLLIAHCLLLIADGSFAEIRDQVVAFIDDQAITLSEFDEQYGSTRKLFPDISKAEVMNTMINRLLLLREARHYRIEAPTKDDLIKEYIDLKIRAFIRVGEDDIEHFYQENKAKFSGKDYEDVREEIERYLTDKELNEKLRVMLKELRGKAYIKVFLQGDQGH